MPSRVLTAGFPLLVLLTALAPPPAQALDTVIVEFTVPCHEPDGAASPAAYGNLPSGIYTYSIWGACNYAMNAPADCYVSLHSAIYHGCGSEVEITNCDEDTYRSLNVWINDACVGPSPGHTVFHPGGPIRAKFHEIDVSHYGDNVGEFVISLTWTPLTSTDPRPGVEVNSLGMIFVVPCNDPNGVSSAEIPARLPAGDYRYLIAGACDYGRSARPGCYISLHVLDRYGCDHAFSPTGCPSRSVFINDNCVAPSNMGIITHPGGYASAKFWESELPHYDDNLGTFVVVLERVVGRTDSLVPIGQ